VVIDMTDAEFEAEERERRRRIISESRADVERWKVEKKNREKLCEEIERLPAPEIARRLIPAAPDDCVQRWAADAAKRERERAAAKAELATRSGAADLVYKRHENAVEVTRAGDDWNAWFDERLAYALDRERAALVEGIGEGLAQLLADEREATTAAIRDQVRELKIETTSLRSEVIELRTQLALERGKVVDPLPRRSLNS
jgi:hypothetical protein